MNPIFVMVVLDVVTQKKKVKTMNYACHLGITCNEKKQFIVLVQRLAQCKKTTMMSYACHLGFKGCNKKNQDDELRLLSQFWKQMEREKNHNDEPGVRSGGFGCCNTRKKARSMSLVSEVFALKINQDNELQLIVLVEQLTECNKNHNDKLQFIVMVSKVVTKNKLKRRAQLVVLVSKVARM